MATAAYGVPGVLETEVVDDAETVLEKADATVAAENDGEKPLVEEIAEKKNEGEG